MPDWKVPAAQQSPVYQFVKKWEIALPLRTPADAVLRAAARTGARQGGEQHLDLTSEARLGR